MIKQRETNSWKSVSYAKSITGAQTYTKFPIVLRTTDQSIPTWSVKGNTETNGTPSLSNPVDVNGVGERTENLFDFLSWANSITSISGGGSFTTTDDSISITSGTSTDAYTSPYGASTGFRISVKPSTTYTCKIGGSGSYQLIIFENGNTSSGYSHYYNVGLKTASFTTKSDTTFVTFRAANTGSLGSTATLSQIMFAEGEYTAQTMLTYEPYGYKIPITSEGENLFDKNNYTFSHLYVASDSKIYSSDTVCAFILNCEPNTTYTVAKMITSRFILWSMANYPEVGGTFTVREADNTAANLTITTGNDDHYILFMFEYTNSSQEAVTEQVANTVMYNTHTTTPIYLGEVQSYREIKKIEYTGAADESWTIVNEGTANAYVQNSGNPAANQGIDKLICTHYEAGEIYNGNTDTGILVVTNGGVRIRDTNAASMSVSSFKAYLQQQYAAGTPLTVWYVLATASTGIVNEPLMKIGNYADTLSNATPIPTTLGLNTIDVNTTLKPSEMSLTYDGYKLCKGQRYSRTENWFDKNNATVYQAYLTDTQWLPSEDSASVKIPCLPNTTYTISVATELPIFRIATSDNLNIQPQNAVDVVARLANVTQYTFTTSSTAQVIIFQGSKAMVNTWLAELMVNTGSTAKPYQPYLDWE